MNTNIEIVKGLYSDGKFVDEMIEHTKKELEAKQGLKIWEADVISLFPVKSRILDIGCGAGREAFRLHDMGFTVTAIDICEKAIESAKKLAAKTNRHINFLLTNGLELPFADNTFDVVIIWAQTFGLFYGTENQKRILSECYRVIKKGGVLSFSCHDKDFCEVNHPQYVVDGKKFFGIADTDCYWELFTIPEVTQLAELAGFEVISCKTDTVWNASERPIVHCECKK